MTITLAMRRPHFWMALSKKKLTRRRPRFNKSLERSWMTLKVETRRMELIWLIYSRILRTY
jgi:hypothetical protein